VCLEEVEMVLQCGFIRREGSTVQDDEVVQGMVVRGLEGVQCMCLRG
jgi:hypothetical protein